MKIREAAWLEKQRGESGGRGGRTTTTGGSSTPPGAGAPSVGNPANRGGAAPPPPIKGQLPGPRTDKAAIPPTASAKDKAAKAAASMKSSVGMPKQGGALSKAKESGESFLEEYEDAMI